MESLPPKTQEQIKKMSTEYLVLKLSKAGLDEEVILKMSREQLMATWADLVATGKDKPAAVAVAAAITKAHYDPELEKQRLQFEMRKYEEEKEKAERLRQEEQAERLQQFEWHKMQADQARAMQEEQFCMAASSSGSGEINERRNVCLAASEGWAWESKAR